MPGPHPNFLLFLVSWCSHFNIRAFPHGTGTYTNQRRPRRKGGQDPPGARCQNPGHSSPQPCSPAGLPHINLQSPFPSAQDQSESHPTGQDEALHLHPLGQRQLLSIRALGGLRECSPEHSYLPGSEEVGFHQVKVLSSSEISSTAHQAVLIRGSKPNTICLANDAVRDGQRDQVRKPASWWSLAYAPAAVCLLWLHTDQLVFLSVTWALRVACIHTGI